METAIALAGLVGARRVGARAWLGDCPACHYPRAFSIRELDERTVFKCHAGCDYAAIVRALGYGPTLRKFPIVAAKPLWERRSQRSDLLSESARRMWRSASAADGTLAETYLRARAITLPLPPTIRYLAIARHTPTGKLLPCLLAAVTRSPDAKVIAIHRTFFAGGPHKSKLEPARMTLGPIAGASVHLGPAGNLLGVAEGIETSLSAVQLSGLPVWAALSAGGIESLILPDRPLAQSVVIFADHDRRGIDAAERAAARWRSEGRAVRIELPAKPGTDFNDVLQSQFASAR